MMRPACAGLEKVATTQLSAASLLPAPLAFCQQCSHPTHASCCSPQGAPVTCTACVCAQVANCAPTDYVRESQLLLENIRKLEAGQPVLVTPPPPNQQQQGQQQGGVAAGGAAGGGNYGMRQGGQQQQQQGGFGGGCLTHWRSAAGRCSRQSTCSRRSAVEMCLQCMLAGSACTSWPLLLPHVLHAIQRLTVPQCCLQVA
jgi:hypothetical protein